MYNLILPYSQEILDLELLHCKLSVQIIEIKIDSVNRALNTEFIAKDLRLPVNINLQ